MDPSPRERILDAARRSVAERGVRGTVVADLLTAAGVSRRTFYKHFRSAEDAISAMYEEVAGELDRCVAEAMSEAPDPVRTVLDSLDAYLLFVERNDPLVACLHAEAATPGSLLGPARRGVLDRQTERLVSGVRENLGVEVDPWVWRGLLLAVEGLVIEAGPPFGAAQRARVRSVVGPMFVSVIASARFLPAAP